MITFIDIRKVKPIKVRGKDTWGWTYQKAGFEPVGYSEGGLLCLQILPQRFPEAAHPLYTNKHPRLNDGKFLVAET
jgi:hypothetical protein